VELVEQLDDAPSLAVRYERTALWIALSAVALITLATYLLFRHLVYRPIERLLGVMSRVEAGDLQAEAPVRASDELGLLTKDFNHMIGRVREMTEEREREAQTLQERVHEATAELEQRNEQLEETNRELWMTARRLTELERLAAAGQTAAQFAHEVGTPLSLISGHVQLLKSKLAGDERAQGRLETISAQIERIERIVRSMLDRTRPAAVELAPLDLNALLERIFEATAPALDVRRVRLVKELQDPLPPVRGNSDRLQQLFINLINNSLDALPEGGEISVRTRTEDDSGDAPRVLIEFSDTGCGMPQEVRAHIFDPLYTTKGRGRGLGLVIVRQVIEEHEGRIEVSSEVGRGTLFHLWIPLIVASAQQEAFDPAALKADEVEAV
ncbi:MAG TPA: ATP-binding protein, partial [Pyrinomonadaceae bacterium]|nr:ATP-binding protein [Pyrinomonadaceae bacterium]